MKNTVKISQEKEKKNYNIFHPVICRAGQKINLYYFDNLRIITKKRIHLENVNVPPAYRGGSFLLQREQHH